jgi:hypothetical protein
MSDENEPKKFKLAPRQNADEAAAKRNAHSNEEAPKKSLSLKATELTPKTPIDPSSRINVDAILEHAYAPDHKRLKRSKLLNRITSTATTLGLFCVSAGLTYAYAHLYKHWPELTPTIWYLPFVISVVFSVAAILKAYQFLKKRHSLSLMTTGLGIAAALAYWNVTVLEVACMTGSNSASPRVWEPKDMTEALITYELNICRGKSPNATTYVSIDRYEAMFKNIPRNQWKSYFRLYLSPEEFSTVNVTNIDEKMHLVAGRMQAKQNKEWEDFKASYAAPSFTFRLKQIAVKPYTTVLKYI